VAKFLITKELEAKFLFLKELAPEGVDPCGACLLFFTVLSIED
jgi:hypothetical protein